MAEVPSSPTLDQVARRLFWWKEPAEALSDPHRFVAQAMVFATPEELAVVRRRFPKAVFVESLRRAPAGLFDPRSWAYWHLMLDLGAPPEPPKRADELLGHAP